MSLIRKLSFSLSLSFSCLELSEKKNCKLNDNLGLVSFRWPLRLFCLVYVYVLSHHLRRFLKRNRKRRRRKKERKLRKFSRLQVQCLFCLVCFELDLCKFVRPWRGFSLLGHSHEFVNI